MTMHHDGLERGVTAWTALYIRIAGEGVVTHIETIFIALLHFILECKISSSKEALIPKLSTCDEFYRRQSALHKHSPF